MNYLELTRRLASEVGASGFIQTVQNPEGETQRLANWIQEAWLELQLVRDTWRWRLAEFEVTLPSGQAKLDMSSYPDFYRVIVTALYGKPHQSTTWAPLDYIGYSDWQSVVRSRPTVVSTPTTFTELPDLSVELSPIPSSDFDVRGLYVRKAQVLQNDFDVPVLPEEFHMAIVYKAMMLYAGYEAAPEIFQSGLQGFNRIYRLMVNSDTGPVTLGGALA